MTNQQKDPSQRYLYIMRGALLSLRATLGWRIFFLIKTAQMAGNESSHEKILPPPPHPQPNKKG